MLRTSSCRALAAAALGATMLLAGLSVVPAASATSAPIPPTAGESSIAAAGAVADRLRADARGAAVVAPTAADGRVHHVRAVPGRTLGRPAGVRADAAPETVARGFLQSYGRAFGVSDEASELRTLVVKPQSNGRASVRLRQVVRGIPVLGGELVVQTTSGAEVTAADGETARQLPASVVPRISAAAAAATAVAATARASTRPAEKAVPAGTTASSPELWVYDPTVLGVPDDRGTRLVWRTEVRAGATVRRLVLVDAHLGTIALSVDLMAGAKQRRVCDNGNDPSNAHRACTDGIAARTEVSGPASGGEAEAAFVNAGRTYDFYLNTLGRDSINGNGMTITSVVRYCEPATCPYHNAMWDGAQMIYGDGYASADDVVAHELTHGVTQHESNLFYLYQSGAINEALSDIMGEVVDLANGPDAAEDRWLIGEDLPDGAIRDMANPTANNDPDKTSSPYFTADKEFFDNGGVHVNSGVANKAASLIADGGSFNGRTVNGIGLSKLAKLFYRAQDHLTSGADYIDLYHALNSACSALVTGGAFTSSDCSESVTPAVLAVEMDRVPPAVKTVSHGIYCPSGAARTTTWKDDLENPASGNWYETQPADETDTVFYPQNPNSWGMDATYATSGTKSMWIYASDKRRTVAISRSTSYQVPTTAAAYLSFRSSWRFDSFEGVNYDGGAVEVSVDNQPWKDASFLQTVGGFNGTVASTDSTLAGRRAFVGSSFGYTSTRIDLTPLRGHLVRFRFLVATDTHYSDWGWFIDDVETFTCPFMPTTTTVHPTAGAVFAGAPVTVYGRVVRSGTTTPVAGLTVAVQRRTIGTSAWTTATVPVTSSTGYVAYQHNPASTTEYRVYFPGAQGLGPSLSATAKVEARPIVRAAFSRPIIRLGETSVLSGTVSPNQPGRPIYLQEYVSGAFRTVRSTTISSTGRFALAIKPPARGMTFWRLYLPASATNAFAVSSNVAMRID